MMLQSLLFILIALLASASAQAEEMRVVASIRPLHSLVAAVMDGVGSPGLLVEGVASPHGYQLKPSQRRMLGQADVIFYVDEKFETFLAHALPSLPASAQTVALAQTAEIPLLPLRAGGVWEKHSHPHEHGHEQEDEPGGRDYHIWLNPRFARMMVQQIAAVLAARDPAHADRYTANALRFETDLAALDEELATMLSGVAERPFIVFHDGLQYVETRYGLQGVGSITLHPELPPSAARLVAIRDKIRNGGAVCVFSEPQFSPRVMETVTEGTNVRRAVVDYLGYDLATGKDHYARMMRHLASAIATCLAPSS